MLYSCGGVLVVDLPADICFADAACPTNTSCIAATCLGPCTTTVPDGVCDQNFACTGGKCLPVSCSINAPEGFCDAGYDCTAGECLPLPDCSTDEPTGYCSPGNICAEGECVDQAACTTANRTGFCPRGLYCLDGTCAPTPDCSVEFPTGRCPEGERCIVDGCVPVPCNVDALDGFCQGDNFCSTSGACQPYPCSTDYPAGTCGDTQECVKGVCEDICATARCGLDQICCASEYECIDIACIPKCATTESRCATTCCDPGWTCENDACQLTQSGCVDDSACMNDSYCDCASGPPCAPLGVCTPFTTENPTNDRCTNLVVVGVFAPDQQCSWTGPTDNVEHCPASSCDGKKTCVAGTVAGENLCIGCELDSDCDSGEVCDDSICRRGCPTGDECETYETCVPAAADGRGACYECSAPYADTDCYGGLTCASGFCIDPYVNHTRVLSTPTVIDFNFDNDPTTSHPSIIMVATDNAGGGGADCRESGIIRVLDGKTCKTQFVVNRRTDDVWSNALGATGRVGLFPDVRACNPVALGDLNGGRPEIVAHAATFGADNGGLLSFTYDPSARGTLGAFKILWHSTTTTGEWDLSCANQGQWWAAPSLYDLDGDGKFEALMAGHTYDAAGKHLDAAFNNCRPYNQGIMPVVADIDGNGKANFVTGGGIYEWDALAQQWGANSQTQSTVVGQVALADFGTYVPGTPDTNDRTTLDGIAEFARVRHSGNQPGFVSLHDVSGRVLPFEDGSDFIVSINQGVGGPPTIGDFDGDCRVEVAVASQSVYAVYDIDCDGTPKDPVMCNGNSVAPCATADATGNTGLRKGVLWEVGSQDNSSNVTGSSVFDFEGDGRAEAIYADECFTRVYDGVTGYVIYSQYRSSCTWYENPVVADVDGDFNAELVVPSNTNCNIPCSGSTENASASDTRQVDREFAGLSCFSDADCAGGAGACACIEGVDPVDGTCLPSKNKNDVIRGLCTCTTDVDCGGSSFICADRKSGTAFLDGRTPNQVCRAEYVERFNGLLVYRDVLDRWVDTARIWNQHAYSITHVNEDGSAANATNRNWVETGLNNFRQNVLGDVNPEYAPDFTAGNGQRLCFPDEGGLLGRANVQVCNRGTARVAAVPVAFYDGDPEAGGVLRCLSNTQIALEPAQCTDVRCRWDDCNPAATMYVRADDDGTGGLGERECIEGNNTAVLDGR